MPIATAVAAVLDGRADIDTAIDWLLTRPVRGERDSPDTACRLEPNC
jgi:hypothetical protein